MLGPPFYLPWKMLMFSSHRLFFSLINHSTVSPTIPLDDWVCFGANISSNLANRIPRCKQKQGSGWDSPFNIFGSLGVWHGAGGHGKLRHHLAQNLHTFRRVPVGYQCLLERHSLYSTQTWCKMNLPSPLFSYHVLSNFTNQLTLFKSGGCFLENLGPIY